MRDIDASNVQVFLRFQWNEPDKPMTLELSLEHVMKVIGECLRQAEAAGTHSRTAYEPTEPVNESLLTIVLEGGALATSFSRIAEMVRYHRLRTHAADQDERNRWDREIAIRARAILEEDLQSFDGLVRLSERIIKVVEQEVRETDKYFQKPSFAD